MTRSLHGPCEFETPEKRDREEDDQWEDLIVVTIKGVEKIHQSEF